MHWIFKNKDHGKMSATASLGTVLLWDVEGGLPQIDRFLYSTDNQVGVGGGWVGGWVGGAPGHGQEGLVRTGSPAVCCEP